MYSFVMSISLCLSNDPQFLLFYLLVMPSPAELLAMHRGAQKLQGAPVGKRCSSVTSDLSELSHMYDSIKSEINNVCFLIIIHVDHFMIIPCIVLMW